MKGLSNSGIHLTNGHIDHTITERQSKRTVKGLALAWITAIFMSWLMGLGVVKLIDIFRDWFTTT